MEVVTVTTFLLKRTHISLQFPGEINTKTPTTFVPFHSNNDYGADYQ